MRIGLITGAGRADTYFARTASWDGVEVVPVEVVESGFPKDEVDLRLKELIYLDAGLRAARLSCDALVVNTVCDYGFSLLRSAVSVPVVGAGHAAVHAAIGLGRMFSIVTVWPESTRFIYERLLANYGLSDRCASIVHVNSESRLADLGGAVRLMNDLERGSSGIEETILVAARTSVSAGAEVVVLGCCCMASGAGWLREQLDVPVVEPFATACRTAEMLVRLGLRHSPATYRPASLGDLARVHAIVGTLQSPAEAADEDCLFCVGDPDALTPEASRAR